MFRFHVIPCLLGLASLTVIAAAVITNSGFERLRLIGKRCMILLMSYRTTIRAHKLTEHPFLRNFTQLLMFGIAQLITYDRKKTKMLRFLPSLAFPIPIIHLTHLVSIGICTVPMTLTSRFRSICTKTQPHQCAGSIEIGRQAKHN